MPQPQEICFPPSGPSHQSFGCNETKAADLPPGVGAPKVQLKSDLRFHRGMISRVPAHADMQLTEVHFNAIAENLIATLEGLENQPGSHRPSDGNCRHHT